MPPDVRATLSDPRYVVVPAPPAGPVGTMAWLRASVSRFCSGAEHARRRALVEGELARLDCARLRARAREVAPVRALAEELGAPAGRLDAIVAAVQTISPFYLDGTPDAERRRADAAVASLVEALAPEHDLAVARIAVLAQAHAATEALIANALDLARSLPAVPPVTFGWGPRACPGAEHALALAAGAVEAALP